MAETRLFSENSEQYMQGGAGEAFSTLPVTYTEYDLHFQTHTMRTMPYFSQNKKV